ncbi:MAG TPA: GNAT family N-acetyltransferase [Flavilitoribacter sp.]|nr:GNAT family N-acetyltransferase [Flavilitoribacter sp.]
MKIKCYTQYDRLDQDGHAAQLETFVLDHSQGSFFQSPDFFKLMEDVREYRPIQLVAVDDSGKIAGSLLGVFQINGSGIKSWLSRRLIVWGGPLVRESAPEEAQRIASAILSALKKRAGGQAIFVEFRNFFDTADLRATFLEAGYKYRPHLNYLVKTDTEADVKKRMSSSRMRQVKSSLKAGAEIVSPADEQDITAFYEILRKLYKEKVKKPLPGPDLFIKGWKTGVFRYFLVRYNDRIVGGIACPVYAGKVIYEWYVCGEDGQEKGVHPSVLATWAPIEYGLHKGFDHFDFMGAGKPDQDYGVREFKARFGGEEVCYGRYEMVLNKPLYTVGKLGIQVYQKLT